MKTILQFTPLFLILLFDVSTSKSQNILTDSTRKKGVYLTYEEFLSNSPSGLLDFLIETEEYIVVNQPTNSVFKGGSVSALQSSFVAFKLKDTNGKKIKGSLNFWGFSDGYNVYVSGKHIKRDFFVKISEIGKYCFFFQLGNDTGYVKPGYNPDPTNPDRHYQQAAYTNAQKVYKLAQYAFDISDGEIFRLTKKTLLNILQTERDLYEKAEKEEVYSILITYIAELNRRHE